jgi:hypothetical protein
MSAEQLEIIAPAVVIGVLVALVHAPLGIEVLKRGIVFIDLAIAQIAGLTIVLTGVLMHGTTPVARDAIAIGAAVAAAAFFRWVEKALPNEQEAVIGGCFIVAASATLLALVNHPHGGEEIQHILSGQILLASWPEIARTAPLLAGVLVLWVAVPREPDPARARGQQAPLPPARRDLGQPHRARRGRWGAFGFHYHRHAGGPGVGGRLCPGGNHFQARGPRISLGRPVKAAACRAFPLFQQHRVRGPAWAGGAVRRGSHRRTAAFRSACSSNTGSCRRLLLMRAWCPWPDSNQHVVANNRF